METLVVLAAGMGSRYGGLKQIESVGPAGETILDYGVFDAVRAGFGRVVFVIRDSFEAEFRTRIGARYEGRIEVGYAFQDSGDLPGRFQAPPGRVKPWGTGHAVWCARRCVDGPFAVINADDFYGREAFARLAGFLRSPSTASRPSFAIAAYRLDQTLSENGAVARGICDVGLDGKLQSVTEQTGILPEQVGPGRRYAADTTVSMNCWGFTPALFSELEQELREFLQAHQTDLKAEFYLPAAVSALIAKRKAEVTVLRTTATWHGVTYREDKPRLVAALQAMIARGDYPAALTAPLAP